MTVVVTGATGFIGRHLCAELKSRGMDVVALGRKPSDAGVGFRLCGDLADCPLAEVLKAAHTVVHLAGLAHESAIAAENAGDRDLFVRVNELATERLAREAAAAGVQHLIFASTIGVCGEETHGVPFTEESPPAPRSLYARSKLEAELRLARVGADTGLRITVFRPTLVYGPGNGGNFLRLLRLVDREWPLPFGAVRNRRNLAYVGNLVSAICAAVESSEVRGLFLACDRDVVSTAGLVRELAAGMGRRASLLAVPPRLLGLAATMAGQGDAARRLIGSLEADSRKIERELAWSPPFEVTQALRLTARWFAERSRPGR
jgi:nucleoside-diphosphate-sugar epimerase